MHAAFLAGVVLAHCVLCMLCRSALGKVYNLEVQGAIPDTNTYEVQLHNTEVTTRVLSELLPGDTLVIPNKTFHIDGNVQGRDLHSVTIRIDGTLNFTGNPLHWPRKEAPGIPWIEQSVHQAMEFTNLQNVTFTSSGVGTLDGNGRAWWGALNYAFVWHENRPKIMTIDIGSHVTLEHLHFENPAYWTTFFTQMYFITIRYCAISVHVLPWSQAHNPVELTAFNTDGFDISGTYVHVHDVHIWNDDDCITVKDVNPDVKNPYTDCSSHWLVERVNVSGVGLTIGSIQGYGNITCVRNITFRDARMINPYKGIYLKSGSTIVPGGGALIEDILYENILIEHASNWPIFIGPANQGVFNESCSLLWPHVPGFYCTNDPNYSVRNVVLRNITINEPKINPGVLIGSSENPMEVTFVDVVVNDPRHIAFPYGKDYACYGVNGTATGKTSPVPSCFNGGRQCLSSGQCRDWEGTPCCSNKDEFALTCPWPVYKLARCI